MKYPNRKTKLKALLETRHDIDDQLKKLLKAKALLEEKELGLGLASMLVEEMIKVVKEQDPLAGARSAP